jgi:hypothetical protein
MADNDMEISLKGVRFIFEDAPEPQLDAKCSHLLQYGFDEEFRKKVTAFPQVRWAQIITPPNDGPVFIVGRFATPDECPQLSGPYIFLNKCLKPFLHYPTIIDTALLHELSHFASDGHDAPFMEAFLRAADTLAWVPLIGKPVSNFTIQKTDHA